MGLRRGGSLSESAGARANVSPRLRAYLRLRSVSRAALIGLLAWFALQGGLPLGQFGQLWNSRQSVGSRRSPVDGFNCPENLLVRRELILALADAHPPYSARRVDEEQRRAGDVPRVDPDAVPDAIGPDHIAGVVDEDVERQARVLDVAADLLGPLGEDGHDLDAAREIFRGVLGQFTEPAAAVRSPRAAVEGQQHRASRKEVRERPLHALLRQQSERRRLVAGSKRVGFSSHTNPAD